MDDSHPLLFIAVFIAFIVIDFIFFGFGAAIQNVNETDLEKDMEEGDLKAGRILKIVNRPGRFINSIQIASVLIGFITGAFLAGHVTGNLSAALERSGLPGARVISYFLVFLVALVAMVSFGIVIPKRLTQRKPKTWARKLIGPVRVLMVLFSPVICPIHALSGLVLKCFGIDMNRHEENVTEEDIMSMVNEGHEQGVVESSEAEMITNIFELNDKQASDVMTHRKNVVSLDGKMLLKDAVDFMLTEGSNSRYPVYQDNTDNIIGILNMKDALVCTHEGEYQDRSLMSIPGLLREAHFIPETRALDTLFKEMQSQKIHMEIVVDEYGQNSGIVTMEDILEEIVGNIMDEYDDEEEMITPLNNGVWIMNGLTPLEDITDATGIRFADQEYEDFDTLNGFLISRLDRIPADGEQFTVEADGCEFRALHVQNRIVRSARVSKKEKPMAAAQEEKAPETGPGADQGKD
jgi:putative hemolysin